MFSAKSGESYLSRKGRESIKDMPSGEFKKTITETVFSDTPTERTIVYKAPFFKKCREDDYKESWEWLAGMGDGTAAGTAIDRTWMRDGDVKDMATQTTTEKLTKATMKRLKGFDYSKPYFYMVTLKRVKGLRPFCEITKEKEPPKDSKGRVRYLVANELTAAFARVIREFHTKWWGLWPIDCFMAVLSPEGFHERWHPGRQDEKYCSEGRILFLSLYPVMDRLPTKQELY